MSRMVFSEVIGTMSFLRPQCDDDFVDRLHYYYTTTFLLVVAVLISLKMFGGSPIECWLPAEFRPSWQEYTELFCWSMSTYFVPGFNSNANNHLLGSDQTDQTDQTDHRKEGSTLAYYQWTPFFLVFCALLFYSPCLVWRNLSAKSGLVLNEIVAFSNAIDQCPPTFQSLQLRSAKLRGVATHLSSAFRHRLKWQQNAGSGNFWPHFEFSESVRHHGAYLSLLYISIKLVFLVIVFLQACLMNRFLQTDDYDFYGFGVLVDLLQGKAWSDSGNFPRITFCDIDVRILGTVQRHTVQCILVINIFTEKVFVLLWFWYSLLLLITLINLFNWLFLIFPFSARRQFIVRRLQMTDLSFELNKSNEALVDEFVCNFLKIDGCFVLRMVDMHTVEWICADIVDAIWEDFVSEKMERKGRKEGLNGKIEKGKEFPLTEADRTPKRMGQRKVALMEPLLVSESAAESLPNHHVHFIHYPQPFMQVPEPTEDVQSLQEDEAQ